MPIYEYQCKSCGHQLEAFQKITDEALKNCPECQQPTLNKLISSTSFQLKGTGWYATDFKDKNKPKENKSDVSLEANKNESEKTPATKEAPTQKKDKESNSSKAE